jgi:hypothetical protein
MAEESLAQLLPSTLRAQVAQRRTLRVRAAAVSHRAAANGCAGPRQRDSIVIVMREALSPWIRLRKSEESRSE